MAEERFKLPGRERTTIRGATVLGLTESDDCLVVQEVKRQEELPALLSNVQIVTREDFVASYAATANDFLTVHEFACDYGSEKTAKSAANHTVMRAGTVTANSPTFGVTLQNVREITAPRETRAFVASAAPVTPETIPLPRICRSAPIVDGLRITAVMSMVVTAGIVATVASS